MSSRFRARTVDPLIHARDESVVGRAATGTTRACGTVPRTANREREPTFEQQLTPPTSHEETPDPTRVSVLHGVLCGHEIRESGNGVTRVWQGEDCVGAARGWGSDGHESRWIGGFARERGFLVYGRRRCRGDGGGLFFVRLLRWQKTRSMAGVYEVCPTAQSSIPGTGDDSTLAKGIGGHTSPGQRARSSGVRTTCLSCLYLYIAWL